MQRLAVDIHGRHALDIELRHLVLAHATVYHFAAHLGVEQGHHVEGLHHIGAVGAGE
jgi:hypothetical protein